MPSPSRVVRVRFRYRHHRHRHDALGLDLARSLDWRPERCTGLFADNAVVPARSLLDDATAAFEAGEIRRASDLAVQASARAAADGDTAATADAALVVWGVPDPFAAAAVERLAREALLTDVVRDRSIEARLRAQLAIALHHRERLDEADAEATRALAIAEDTGDPDALAAALNARAL